MGDETEFDFGSTTSSDDTSGLDWSGVGDIVSDYGSLAGSFLPTSGATYQPAMASVGSFGAAAGAAVLTLGARLAGMFGRGAGSAVINGVKFSMASLWPYIRKYGPAAVATGLGISVAQLGALAMAAPQHKRHRRRGISAADISRAKRVIRFNRRLTRSLGTGGGRSRGGYRGRSRGHYAYIN